MGFKVKIEGAETIDLSIESVETVKFSTDTPKDTNARSKDVGTTMVITGKILTAVDGDPFDSTRKMGTWSLVPAEKADCYRKVTVDVISADQVIRKITYPNAFVVDYREHYGDTEGIGTFELIVRGASVFGWAGIDGIHFCFIRGFGEMVFSVSPMNTSPDYVHPVAENFTDFLRLILACGDVAAVEQAWMWNEAQFEAFLNENPTTQEQQQTLSEISEKMNLLPMEQPWTYIKNLQSSFDYSQIKYTEDYYDNDMTSEAELVAPEWKVYFDGDFWGHRGKDRAGKEIKLDKQFDWAGYHWVIPAAYSCSKGLVVDFCMRVDSESIRDFMKKWNLDWENDSCENFTREQQMQMEWENPLCFNFKPCLKLNEKILQTTHGCAVSFNPCLPDGVINELEAKWAIDHYGLDSTYGWVICRDVFPWGTKHHPEINKLFLTMEQQPGQVPGSHFKVHAPGDSFMFSHPVSGITHTLTVQEIEQQTVPQNSFGSDRWIYPTHYIAMSYTLTPEPMENISVFDCDEGDRPIEVTPDDHSFRPVGSSSCFVVGVIGGADGPTAVIYGTNSQEKLHAACSALHFEPVGDDVEWRIVFNVTQFDKETFPII